MNLSHSSLGHNSVFRLVPEKELGLQHFQYRTPQFFPERRLPEFAMVCCFSGRIDVWENSVRTTLEPGDILIGNPGLLRGSQYIPEGGVCEGVTAVVGTRAMRRIMSELRLVGPGESAIILGKIAAPAIVQQAKNAAEVLASPRHGAESYLDGFLNQFVVEVLWKWPNGAIVPRDMKQSLLLSRRHFVHAVEYMNRCEKNDFAVETLCEEIGISMAHFRRLLFASAQRSPLDFYNRVLIRRAESMIRGRQSLKQVSYALGFASQSQFGKMFRRLTGLTPSEFQERGEALVSQLTPQGSLILSGN